MNMRQYKKILLLFSFALLVFSFAFSQDTAAKRRSIDITSSFKPVLREAVKINFNAAAPVVDTSKPKLTYSIPQQNLLLGYLPAQLKPVALQIDTVNAWKYSNYIKLGAGNVHIPYAQAGFSFGDGKNSFFNAFAKGYTSKGKYNDFQKNNYAAVSLDGTVRTAANLEWNGNIGFKSEDYFFYGYQPQTLVFTKDQLRQRFQDYQGKLSLRNMQATEYGLTYSPNIKIDVFGGNNFMGKATETNTLLNLPLTKTFGETFSFNLGLTADLTHYKPVIADAIQNNLFYVSPAVHVKADNFTLTAGVSPAWDNKLFHLLPNIMADVVTNDKSFTLQAGWIGYYDKGSYQRYAGINPWIAEPTSLLNTRSQELYAGIKGSILDHFSYSAKVSAVQYRNLALFANDSIDGKTFKVLTSPSVQAIKIHGEIAWTQGEDISWINGITATNYTKVEGQLAPWGLSPLEINSSLRWQMFKDFFLKGDLYGYGGAPYQEKVSTSVYKNVRGQSGIDVNAGVEFKVTRALDLWLQMNNIFNNKYERWHQYPVYGFNILGGIVFRFDQK
ncbi:MAG TPA: hypothetical protein VKI61_08145 [Chitinophagaceae bacterium]|jgi:hypothetical protein|nr:hypothetical protein [Chitinophagaceae bacterium]